MKIKLLLTLLVAMLSFSNSYASFPVKRTVATTTNAEITSDDANLSEVITPLAAVASKDKVTALLLWFFLGGFAAHRWYLGSPWYWNVLFIITLGGIFVWAIIDLIDIITDKYPGL